MGPLLRDLQQRGLKSQLLLRTAGNVKGSVDKHLQNSLT